MWVLVKKKILKIKVINVNVFKLKTCILLKLKQK